MPHRPLHEGRSHSHHWRIRRTRVARTSASRSLQINGANAACTDDDEVRHSGQELMGRRLDVRRRELGFDELEEIAAEPDRLIDVGPKGTVKVRGDAIE